MRVSLKQLSISLLGSGLILGAGMVGALNLLNQTTPEVTPEPPLPVVTVPLEVADSYTERRRYAGVISARRASEVGFELAGRLMQVTVDEGDNVRTGQLLARLDPARLERQRDALQAQLAGAEAELRLAELTRDRNQDLRRRGVASAQTLDETRLQAEAAAARVRQLQASLEQLAVELDNTRLNAPFAGVVVRRLLDEGTVVAAGTPVLALQEQQAPEARVGLPVDVARRIQPGAEYPVTVARERFIGRVSTVLPQVDRVSRTVVVVLELAAEARVPDGALAQLDLLESVQSEGYWVPLSALTEGLRGLWTVYSLEPEDGTESIAQTRRRVVEVLHVDDTRAFVRGTLEPGLTLVGEGVHRLVAGQRVVPAGEALAATAGDAP